LIVLNHIAEASGYEGVTAYQRLHNHFPGQAFVPSRPGADLIRAVGEHAGDAEGSKRVFLVTSANGTGKTTTAINICYNLAYPGLNTFMYAKDMETGEEFPGFFNYPFFQNFPKDWPKSIWYVSNKDALKSIDKKFKMWASKDVIAEFKYNNQRLDHIDFPGSDWDMYFKTIDQDPQTFETADISVIIFDEPPPYRLFAAAVSRVRSGGIIIIPATPLFTAAWFVDNIIDVIKSDGEKSDMMHQTVNVWTNCIEKAGWWDLGWAGIQPKGNLWKTNIDFMIKHWDPDELEARRDGEFKYLTGLVYKIYDPIIWLKTTQQPSTNPKYYAYRMLIDPHERRPPAMYWERIYNNGNNNYRYVMRIWPSREDTEFHGLPFHRIKDAGKYTIKDFVRIIKRIEEDLRIPLRGRIKRIMDPNFGNKRDADTGLTTAQMYKRAATELLKEEWSFNTKAVDNLYYGHDAVKQLLKQDSNNYWPVLLDPICDEIDYGFRHYSWEDLTAKQAEKKEVALKVKEIGKDFMDLLRYDAMVPITMDEWIAEYDPYEDRDYEERRSDYDRSWTKAAPPRPAGARGA
jgi:hypothetical protein